MLSGSCCVSYLCWTARQVWKHATVWGGGGDGGGLESKVSVIGVSDTDQEPKPKQRQKQEPHLTPARSGSGPAQPEQLTAPWTRLWGHGDCAIPTSQQAIFSGQGATCVIHAPNHTLVLTSSCQSLPILSSQWRLAGKSSGKGLDSKAPLWNNYSALFNSNISLNTKSKQTACAPELPDYCRARSCCPWAGNPPAKRPRRVHAHTQHCVDSLRKAGKAWRNTVPPKRNQLPVKTTLHLLQPCFSCIKILQLGALKLQLNCSNLRLSQEQRAVAALQQTPLTT